MTTTPDQSRTLDAAYKPFPTFLDWQARTSVESTRWSTLVQKLREARDAAGTLTSRALEVAKRAAAFDTGAIENLYETDRGFTYSVAFQTGAWELGLLERGEQVRPLFEAQMHAYDFVLDLATGSEPVSEAAIRRLHEVICAAQDTYQVQTSVGPQNQPLPKGVYKALPNHVRTRTGEDHSYAPVDLTPAEMHRLVQELRSGAFLAAHPIQQAAYAHYCFVAIHPFADGNGRVARALASLYTYRAASAPIIILSEDKPRYLDALVDADAGAYQAFNVFLFRQAVSTLELVDESLRLQAGQEYTAAIAELEALLAPKGGLAEEEVDRRGKEFAEAFQGALERTLKKRDRFSAQVFTMRLFPKATSPNPRQRNLAGEDSVYLQITISTIGPVAAGASRDFSLFVPIQGLLDQEVTLWSKKSDAVSARLDELDPISGFVRMRLEMRAEEVAAELVGELAQEIQNRLI